LSKTVLLDLTGADFDWLGGGAENGRGLKIPPGGAEHPEVLPEVRRISQRHFASGYRGSWMMVCGVEVVGLGNFIRPPRDGVVEIDRVAGGACTLKQQSRGCPLSRA
jgi:hypothetical protein